MATLFCPLPISPTGENQHIVVTAAAWDNFQPESGVTACSETAGVVSKSSSAVDVCQATAALTCASVEAVVQQEALRVWSNEPTLKESCVAWCVVGGAFPPRIFGVRRSLLYTCTHFGAFIVAALLQEQIMTTRL